MHSYKLTPAHLQTAALNQAYEEKMASLKKEAEQKRAQEQAVLARSERVVKELVRWARWARCGSCRLLRGGLAWPAVELHAARSSLCSAVRA